MDRSHHCLYGFYAVGADPTTGSETWLHTCHCHPDSAVAIIIGVDPLVLLSVVNRRARYLYMRFPQQHTLDRAFHRHEAGKMTEKPSSRRTPNPLIHVPIAPRLVLGFLLPALIAALVAGIIGLQSAQLLSQESSFYQQLFQSYAPLTTGNTFLDLLDVQFHAPLNTP